jgi:hypothetical protein
MQMPTTNRTPAIRSKSAPAANPRRDDIQDRLITAIASLECVLGVLECHGESGARLASAELLLRETITRLHNLEIESLQDRVLADIVRAESEVAS